MCDSTFHCVFWRPHRVLKILGKHHWGHEETTLQVQFCGIWNDRKNTWMEWGTSKLNDATIILFFYNWVADFLRAHCSRALVYDSIQNTSIYKKVDSEICFSLISCMWFSSNFAMNGPLRLK